MRPRPSWSRSSRSPRKRHQASKGRVGRYIFEDTATSRCFLLFAISTFRSIYRSIISKSSLYRICSLTLSYSTFTFLFYFYFSPSTYLCKFPRISGHSAGVSVACLSSHRLPLYTVSFFLLVFLCYRRVEDLARHPTAAVDS